MDQNPMLFLREEITNEGATSSSTSSLFAFEEEVASLLLDMRDRIVLPRKAMEEGRQDFGIDPRDTSLNSADSYLSRKRKASFDSEDSLDGMVEDVNEIEEQDEPEWKHEEDYLAEDDDEWLDSNTGFYSAGDSKTPRKKAPSGSACEKHKRWKKRCPEDCPMRKQKSKKRFDNSEMMDSDSSPTTSPTLERRVKKVAPIESDYLALFRLPVYSSVANGDNFAKLCAPGNTAVSREEKRMKTRSEHSPKLERKAATRYAQFSSGDDLSPVEGEDAFDLKDDDISSPEMKSFRGSPKVKRTRNAKSKSSRKYLPQACDRHKTLHAKCPANCPDRVKRDAELAKQQKLQPSSSTEDMSQLL